MSTSLQGSKTHQNLKEAFAGESQVNRRYWYFANKRTLKAIPTWPRCFAPPCSSSTLTNKNAVSR